MNWAQEKGASYFRAMPKHYIVMRYLKKKFKREKMQNPSLERKNALKFF